MYAPRMKFLTEISRLSAFLMSDWGSYAPVVLAALSYVANTVFAAFDNERAAKLERTNQQIKQLYGPLFAFNEVDTLTWVVFEKQCPEYHDAWCTDAELAVNARRWFKEVFWPISEARRQVGGHLSQYRHGMATAKLHQYCSPVQYR